MKITEDLRKRLAAQKQTVYALAKATSINRGTIRRFLDGGGLRSEHIDELGEYLQVGLAPLRPLAIKKPSSKTASRKKPGK